MKNVKILLLLIVLCYTQDDMKDQIESLSKNRFGQTLLQTIYLQLQTQEPIERLMGTLQQIEDRYYQDQKEEDQSHHDYQDGCTLDLNNLNQNIKISDQERIRLEAKLEGELYPKRDILQKLITQKQNELKDLKNDLSELDSQRNEESEEHQHKIHEHEEVIAILMQARTLFTEGLQSHDVELLQKHFTTSIKKSSKFTYRNSWSKMFKALSTITSRVEQLQDSQQVENVILLIDQLLEKVHDSMDLEKFTEDKRIQAYSKTRNLLIISINTTDTTLAQAITDIALVNDIIEQTQATLDNVLQRLEMLQQTYDDRFNICEQEAQDYQDSRLQRDQDRDVVSQTIGLLNKSLRTLKEQLALRMSAGDEFDY